MLWASMDLSELSIRQLRRGELDLVVDWAAGEGWNPGLSDAEIFWQTDPDGYCGVEYQGDLVASGSIVSYDGRYGFMGFFIVRPDLRGQGIGTHLWFHRRDLLKSRLDEGASIGMDGVFEMQDWYRRGGFQFTHRNLRMQGHGEALSASKRQPEVIPLSDLPFAAVADYDALCFGCDRSRFLRPWLEIPDALALGFVRAGTLAGYAVIRPCREGYKIGPLFADDAEIAAALFAALRHKAVDEPIWMDVPEVNRAAMALASQHGMTEVFGCARMYHGPIPDLPWQRIFGITTFELG